MYRIYITTAQTTVRKYRISIHSSYKNFFVWKTQIVRPYTSEHLFVDALYIEKAQILQYLFDETTACTLEGLTGKVDLPAVLMRLKVELVE